MTSPLFALSVVREAVVEIFDKRQSLAHGLAFPVGAICLLGIIEEYFSLGVFSSLFFSVANIPFYALFAVVCHRIILLGEGSLPGVWGCFWTSREIRFAGWGIVVVFIAYGSTFVVALIVLLFSGMDVPEELSWKQITVFVIIATYLEGRLSMVLPETAIDRRPTLAQSAALTDGNGVWITIALLIPVVFGFGLNTVFDRIPDTASTTIVSLLYVVIVLLVLTVQIGILSVSYRALTVGTENVAV